MVKVSSFLIRIGLAFSFLYAAVDSFINPDSWTGFFPSVMRNLLAPNILLVVFALVEALLALWLISGIDTFYSAILSAVLLLGIIITNIGAFEIIFRDVTIFFAALALVALHYGEKFSRKSGYF